MLAVVCPGQGSQTPSMLEPWLELPATRPFLEELSDASSVDLIAHGTLSDADTIRDTAIAQPLIVATSLLAAQAIFGVDPLAARPSVVAGHSVGEFSAAALAGAMSPAQAVGLVAHRARAMARAAAAEVTGMAAVVGGKPDEVLDAIEAAGLSAANMNSAGQVVAAGSVEGIEKLVANPPTRARVIPLQVAGAFHTRYMASAQDEFREIAATWPTASPHTPLLSNRDGAAFTGGEHGHGTGSDVVERLVHQITSPVRWDLCQETLGNSGVTGILELAPAGVLTGLAKRSLPGVELFAVKSAADVPAALDFVSTHA